LEGFRADDLGEGGLVRASQGQGLGLRESAARSCVGVAWRGLGVRQGQGVRVGQVGALGLEGSSCWRVHVLRGALGRS
jgi:hypothetical protein